MKEFVMLKTRICEEAERKDSQTAFFIEEVLPAFDGSAETRSVRS